MYCMSTATLRDTADDGTADAAPEKDVVIRSSHQPHLRQHLEEMLLQQPCLMYCIDVQESCTHKAVICVVRHLASAIGIENAWPQIRADSMARHVKGVL